MSSPTLIVWLAVLLVIAQGVLRWYWVHQGYFYLDDYFFIGDIARGIDDWDWYTKIWYGHFMPLSFGLVKIVTLAGPFNWTMAAAQIVALQIAASLTCWWMLTTLFGRTWTALAVFALYVSSALTMPEFFKSSETSSG